jgi:hypothetical protein
LRPYRIPTVEALEDPDYCRRIIHLNLEAEKKARNELDNKLRSYLHEGKELTPE